MLRDFYRMEGKDGQGPYQAQATGWPWDTWKNFEPDRHPAPGEDGIDYWLITDQHVFGFDSLDKALEWFTPEWLVGLSTDERAVPQEFRVTHYRAPEAVMLFGKRQVVADREYLEYVETIELKDLLEHAGEVGLDTLI